MATRRAPGKRAAARPARRPARREVRREIPRPAPREMPRIAGLKVWGVGGLFALAGLGVLAALCRIVGLGPDWLDQVGAVAITTSITVALAARTGGQPILFGSLAAALGILAVGTDSDSLRSGAAAMSAVGTSVLAVMATVPAARFRHTLREVAVVLGISLVGSLAVVGFRPVISLDRFDYMALALAFVLVVALVYRLGAGLAGLGRRGMVVLAGGVVAVAFAIAYAELLRRYGPPGLLDSVFDAVRWWRGNLGAVPRPLMMFVGVPMLVWGCHVRARRRQGWWLMVFGVCCSVTVATLWTNPETSWGEGALILLYSTLPGVLFGYIAIRVDLALTGPRGSRARRAEEAQAARPEPRRMSALL